MEYVESDLWRFGGIRGSFLEFLVEKNEPEACGVKSVILFFLNFFLTLAGFDEARRGDGKSVGLYRDGEGACGVFIAWPGHDAGG